MSISLGRPVWGGHIGEHKYQRRVLDTGQGREIPDPEPWLQTLAGTVAPA